MEWTKGLLTSLRWNKAFFFPAVRRSAREFFIWPGGPKAPDPPSTRPLGPRAIDGAQVDCPPRRKAMRVPRRAPPSSLVRTNHGCSNSILPDHSATCCKGSLIAKSVGCRFGAIAGKTAATGCRRPPGSGTDPAQANGRPKRQRGYRPSVKESLNKTGIIHRSQIRANSRLRPVAAQRFGFIGPSPPQIPLRPDLVPCQVCSDEDLK